MICLLAAQLHQLDQRSMMHGISTIELMGNAAKGIYEVMRDKHLMKRVMIICGAGNNGGDGLALAALYHESFEQVRVLYAAKQAPISEATRYYYKLCENQNLLIHGGADVVRHLQQDYDVIIDGLFGIGLSRDVGEPYASVIEAVNRSPQTILAIDLPSGINSDDGKVKGCAVKADLTVTFVASKPGHWLYPGYLYSKEVLVKEIGIPRSWIEAVCPALHVIDEADLKKLLPIRHSHSHKGSYGKLLGIGGSQEMTGAILMAGEAALRSGCGMCTLAVPEHMQPSVPLYLPEFMSIGLPQEGMTISKAAVQYLQPRLAAYDVIFCGCGGGRSDSYTDLVRIVLDSKTACVIDGDGIYALQYLREELLMRDQIVVTPHVKEMTYLIDQSIDKIIEDPLHAADCFCERYPNAVLVLKSERPLIAYKQERYLCAWGNHALAKGGSGDVLCGLIASFIGQGLDPFHAAILGCGIHAYTAHLIIQDCNARSVLPHEISAYLKYSFTSLETG